MTKSVQSELIDQSKLIAQLQKQLANTEKEFEQYRGGPRWEGQEWQEVSSRATAIRKQLFELTGDHYGKPKVKKVKPTDELLEADYEYPWDVPKDVMSWARQHASLLFSDATDAIRWARIVDTLEDDRFPAGHITIYRAVTEGDSIREGDWVTPNKEYAEMHLARSLNGKGCILELTVDGLDVLVSPTGDYDEAIYAPREFSGPHCEREDESLGSTMVF